MNRTCIKLSVACLGVSAALAASAQSMPEKYDQKCLDDAGKRYITCMANSGTSEPKKQSCQETMAAEKKQCKKK